MILPVTTLLAINPYLHREFKNKAVPLLKLHFPKVSSVASSFFKGICNYSLQGEAFFFSEKDKQKFKLMAFPDNCLFVILYSAAFLASPGFLPIFAEIRLLKIVIDVSIAISTSSILLKGIDHLRHKITPYLSPSAQYFIGPTLNKHVSESVKQKIKHHELYLKDASPPPLLQLPESMLNPHDKIDIMSMSVIPVELHYDFVLKQNICPITQMPIRFALKDPTTGTIYERDALQVWVEVKKTSPISKLPLKISHLKEVPDIQASINARLQHYQNVLENEVASNSKQ